MISWLKHIVLKKLIELGFTALFSYLEGGCRGNRARLLSEVQVGLETADTSNNRRISDCGGKNFLIQ